MARSWYELQTKSKCTFTCDRHVSSQMLHQKWNDPPPYGIGRNNVSTILRTTIMPILGACNHLGTTNHVLYRFSTESLMNCCWIVTPSNYCWIFSTNQVFHAYYNQLLLFLLQNWRSVILVTMLYCGCAFLSVPIRTYIFSLTLAITSEICTIAMKQSGANILMWRRSSPKMWIGFQLVVVAGLFQRLNCKIELAQWSWRIEVHLLSSIGVSAKNYGTPESGRFQKAAKYFLCINVLSFWNALLQTPESIHGEHCDLRMTTKLLVTWDRYHVVLSHLNITKNFCPSKSDNASKRNTLYAMTCKCNWNGISFLECAVLGRLSLIVSRVACCNQLGLHCSHGTANYEFHSDHFPNESSWCRRCTVTARSSPYMCTIPLGHILNCFSTSSSYRVWGVYS